MVKSSQLKSAFLAADRALKRREQSVKAWAHLQHLPDDDPVLFPLLVKTGKLHALFQKKAKIWDRLNEKAKRMKGRGGEDEKIENEKRRLETTLKALDVVKQQHYVPAMQRKAVLGKDIDGFSTFLNNSDSYELAAFVNKKVPNHPKNRYSRSVFDYTEDEFVPTNYDIQMERKREMKDLIDMQKEYEGLRHASGEKKKVGSGKIKKGGARDEYPRTRRRLANRNATVMEIVRDVMGPSRVTTERDKTALTEAEEEYKEADSVAESAFQLYKNQPVHDHGLWEHFLGENTRADQLHEIFKDVRKNVMDTHRPLEGLQQVAGRGRKSGSK